MIETRSELGALAGQWDELARESGSLFMGSAWLGSWWEAFGVGAPLWVLDLDAAGSLRAGTLMMRERGRLVSAANVHSGEWGVLGRDDDARAQVWRAIAEMGAPRVHLEGLTEAGGATGSARSELERAGYRVAQIDGPFSPWVTLPSSWDEFIAAANSSLRQQVGRRRRGLDREGSLLHRTQTGGPGLEQDLECFLALEGAGWKGANGTSILSRGDTERLYRDFARAAADCGALRLNMLELDGTLIAASFDCVSAGAAYLLKTTFSEPHSRLSPGLVLLAEVLRACIEEGVHRYDFMGEADPYKLRWTSEVRPRAQLFAYRGSASLGYNYRKTVRPALKSARDRLPAPVGSRKRGA
jgi:CelD/BcsL family acetyltransferase involved in cellulose biosynthesis